MVSANGLWTRSDNERTCESRSANDANADTDVKTNSSGCSHAWPDKSTGGFKPRAVCARDASSPLASRAAKGNCEPDESYAGSEADAVAHSNGGARPHEKLTTSCREKHLSCQDGRRSFSFSEGSGHAAKV